MFPLSSVQLQIQAQLYRDMHYIGASFSSSVWLRVWDAPVQIRNLSPLFHLLCLSAGGAGHRGFRERKTPRFHYVAWYLKWYFAVRGMHQQVGGKRKKKTFKTCWSKKLNWNTSCFRAGAWEASRVMRRNGDNPLPLSSHTNGLRSLSRDLWVVSCLKSCFDKVHTTLLTLHCVYLLLPLLRKDTHS